MFNEIEPRLEAESSNDDDSDMSGDPSDESNVSNASRSSYFNDQYYLSDDISHSDLMALRSRDLKSHRREFNTTLSVIEITKQKMTEPRPLYTFKPYRFEECKYKLRCNLFDFPCTRIMHSVVATDSNMYCLGGYNGSIHPSRPLRELWAYNYASQRWRIVVDRKQTIEMPKTMLSQSLALYKDKLISFGGTVYQLGQKNTRECFWYNIKDGGDDPNEIVTRFAMGGAGPRPQYGAGIAIVGDYLYKIGGASSRDDCCNYVYRLDLKKGGWELINEFVPQQGVAPINRYFHKVVHDGVYIYVLGGGSSSGLADMKTLPAFNTQTNEWEYFTTLPDCSSVPQRPSSDSPLGMGYPSARNSFACAQHTHANGDKEAFIVGGWHTRAHRTTGTRFLKDTWKLNFRTKQWTYLKEGRVPHPIHLHDGCQTSYGCMYMFGGVEYRSKRNRRVNKVRKMWLTIPKLSEICWDALSHYFDLEKINLTDLKKLGIPISFLNRLTDV